MESLPGIPPSVLTSWAARGLTWTTAQKAGLPDSLIPGDNNNFGPTVGFARKPTPQTPFTMPLEVACLDVRYSGVGGRREQYGSQEDQLMF